jgi:hypothetical protein
MSSGPLILTLNDDGSVTTNYWLSEQGQQGLIMYVNREDGIIMLLPPKMEQQLRHMRAAKVVHVVKGVRRPFGSAIVFDDGSDSPWVSEINDAAWLMGFRPDPNRFSQTRVLVFTKRGKQLDLPADIGNKHHNRAFAMWRRMAG